tara:strand:- start:379 stop:636 length:258 start_codon:yes stop_codon:yes gene_type:complete
MNNTKNNITKIRAIGEGVKYMTGKIDQKHRESELRAIMNSNQPHRSEKVDIIDALRSIQESYAKVGRDIPNFTDSMDLIAHQQSS